MLQYNLDPRFTYIGRSVDLGVRLKDHFNKSALSNNKLGLFLNLVGWADISVIILEFVKEQDLIKRENSFLKICSFIKY